MGRPPFSTPGTKGSPEALATRFPDPTWWTDSFTFGPEPDDLKPGERFDNIIGPPVDSGLAWHVISIHTTLSDDPATAENATAGTYEMRVEPINAGWEHGPEAVANFDALLSYSHEEWQNATTERPADSRVTQAAIQNMIVRDDDPLVMSVLNDTDVAWTNLTHEIEVLAAQMPYQPTA